METIKGYNQKSHNRHNFSRASFRKSWSSNSLQANIEPLSPPFSRETVVSHGMARVCSRQKPDLPLRAASILYIYNKVGEGDYRPRSAYHFRSQISLEQQHWKTL